MSKRFINCTACKGCHTGRGGRYCPFISPSKPTGGTARTASMAAADPSIPERDSAEYEPYLAQKIEEEEARLKSLQDKHRIISMETAGPSPPTVSQPCSQTRRPACRLPAPPLHAAVMSDCIEISTGLVRLYIAGLPLRSCRTIGAPLVCPLCVFSFLAAAGFEPTSWFIPCGRLTAAPL